VATLADLKVQTVNLLGDTIDAQADPDSGTLFSASQLLEGIVAGMDAILPWVANKSVATLDGDGIETEFSLPNDFYRIDGVWDGYSKQFVPRAHISSGQFWADTALDLYYLETPQGKVTFSKALSTNGKLYYSARWTKPSGDTDPIAAPEIAHTAICLYAAAYCLLSSASQSAALRQYNTKVDSGTPEHNPLQEQANYLLSWFENEMARHPSDLRGQS